jgi:hypothetical protein
LAASCAKLYPTFKVSANHPIWNAKTLLCQRNLIPSQLPHTQPAVSTSSTFSRYSNRKSNQFSCTMASRHIPLFGVDWYSFFGLSALYQNNPEKMNERSRTQNKIQFIIRRNQLTQQYSITLTEFTNKTHTKSGNDSQCNCMYNLPSNYNWTVRTRVSFQIITLALDSSI